MSKLRILLAAAVLAWGTSEAGEILRMERSQGNALLYEESRTCPEGAKFIEWVGSNGQTVAGCWFEKHGFVWAWFADGDKLVLPRKDFAPPKKEPPTNTKERSRWAA
jgi:hypothetical protein